jgi:hypothetical protein
MNPFRIHYELDPETPEEASILTLSFPGRGLVLAPRHPDCLFEVPADTLQDTSLLRHTHGGADSALEYRSGEVCEEIF